MKQFASRVQRQVLAGLLIIVPFAVTIMVAVFLYTFIDKIAGPVVRQILPQPEPGHFNLLAVAIHVLLTLLLTVLVLYLAGFVSTTFFTHELYLAGEQLVLKIPLAKVVYGITKQVLQLFSRDKGTRYKRIALVEFPREGMYSVGFVTNETHVEGDPRRFVSVFVPHTPNPMAGFLVIVSDDQVQTLDITVEEAIKLIMSGGVIMPGLLRHAPIPDAARAADLKAI